MKVCAVGTDGTLSEEYDVLPTSTIGWQHRGARAGTQVESLGLVYLVTEDNFGTRLHTDRAAGTARPRSAPPAETDEPPPGSD